MKLHIWSHSHLLQLSSFSFILVYDLIKRFIMFIVCVRVFYLYIYLCVLSLQRLEKAAGSEPLEVELQSHHRSARIKPWSSVRAVCFELLNCVFSTSVCDLKLVCLSPSWELNKGVGKEGTES